MHQLNLSFVAPVPVGHRVQVTFYQRKAGRLTAIFTGQPRGALVRDLDTGIEYSSGFIWQGKRETLSMCIYSSEPEQNVIATGSLEGTVTRCRVISRLGNANNHQVTTQLDVEET